MNSKKSKLSAPNKSKMHTKQNTVKVKDFKTKGTKMFSSDIENAKAYEQRRHNKRDEELTKSGQDVSERNAKRAAQATIIGAGLRGLANIIPNHESGYLQDPAFAEASGDINFTYPFNMMQDGQDLHSTSGSYQAKMIHSGIVVLNGYPSLGKNVTEYNSNINKSVVIYDNADSPISYAMKSMYAFVKSQCRRNLQYTPSDLARFFFSVSDAFEMIAAAQRIYGIANTYKSENRVFGDLLVQSLGGNPANLRVQLSELLFQINKFIKVINTFKLPKNISFFQRRIGLNTHVYLDKPLLRSPLFVFKKVGYYTGNQPAGSHEEVLTFHPITTTNAGITVANGVADMTNIVSRLMDNADVLTVNADISTAYDNEGFFSLPYVDPDYTIVPAYSEDVNNQLRNAIALGDPVDSEDIQGFNRFNMYDLGNGLLVQGYLQTDSSDGLIGSKVLAPSFRPNGLRVKASTSGKLVTHFIGNPVDISKDSPSIGEIFVSTRLSCSVKPSVLRSTNDLSRWTGDVSGTEVIGSYQIWRYDSTEDYKGKGSTSIDSLLHFGYDITQDSVHVSSSTVDYIKGSTQFANMPLGIIGEYYQEHTAMGEQYIFRAREMLGDRSNTQVLNYTVLGKLHYCAIASEFHTKGLGSTAFKR